MAFDCRRGRIDGERRGDALQAAGIYETFKALSYSHRREYVSWIEEAGRPQTRARRVGETIDRVRA
jgi:uncharacterized protein YdeI (YjbR/CyaY-like superfamily)